MVEGEEVLEDAGVLDDAGLGVVVGPEEGAEGLQAARRHTPAARRRTVFFIDGIRWMVAAMGRLR